MLRGPAQTTRLRQLLAGILLLLAPAVEARAENARFDASGYLKTLYRYSRSGLSGSPYWSDLSRVRTTLELSRAAGGEPDAPVLRAHADYDHELLTGSYLHSAEWRRYGTAEPPSYLDMEGTISSAPDAFWRHRLYRGWAELRSESFDLRFGRQRVAWGTGKLWNPTDFLNPYPPASIEREERRGVDALYARRGLGELGQAEGVWTLADRWSASDLLARVRGNRWGSDFSLLAGKVAPSTDSWAAGGDFAADVFDGNFHGEWLYADLKTRTPFWKGLVGYEYDFGSAPPHAWLKNLWALVEYHHNGAGRSDELRYDTGPVTGGREVALARNYLGAGLRKELHPLLQVELYALANLDDQSTFLMPSLDWNALKDLHLLAGFQRFGGTRVSEYGRQPDGFFAQAQYFF
ncbi:MAG: hypothetical protein WC969_11900 [Elusimicrobiota bacterium]|jgi:hypothetical protein